MNPMTTSLASSITKAASKQSYYTARFLVDRERVLDAYRVYGYFRWVDDILDTDSKSQSARRAFLERQKSLLESCYQGESPGNLVHIRYGEKSPGCYCPAARFRPVMAGDLHCECTRTTHQTIFETALGHPVQVEVIESLRRGGQTCHFVVH